MVEVRLSAERLEEKVKELEAENARLRAALFCQKCGGKGWNNTHFGIEDCPTCGPLRSQLKREVIS